MKPGRYILAAIAAVWLFFGAGLPVQATCRQALVIALDVSGSVDEVEYTLQLQGLATALEHPDVKRALFEQPDVPIYLAVFEWSGQDYQRIIVDWRALDGAAALRAVTYRLRSWTRIDAPEATSIGGALRFASATLARAPACWKRTIDVSGDGKNNDWPLPERIRQTAAFQGVTINALVIGTELFRIGDAGPGDVADLTAYFSSQVIQGPEAFVEVALGFENYAAAMTRKLLQELETATLGALLPGVDPRPDPHRSDPAGRDPASLRGEPQRPKQTEAASLRPEARLWRTGDPAPQLRPQNLPPVRATDCPG